MQKDVFDIHIIKKATDIFQNEVTDLLETNYIEILSKRKKVVLSVPTILYVLMTRKCAEIHVSGGTIYETRMTIGELENKLGKGFIKAHRG